MDPETRDLVSDPAPDIQSGSELWWDVRPSQDYPTVEMRICDVCPRLDDALSIVALYASLVDRKSVV